MIDRWEIFDADDFCLFVMYDVSIDEKWSRFVRYI